MLGIDRIDPSRLFYHGDVFIVKFTEPPVTYAYMVNDITSESVLKLIAVLKGLFQNEWENAFIESMLKKDQYFEAQKLKVETDKEILYQRMCVVPTLQ